MDEERTERMTEDSGTGEQGAEACAGRCGAADGPGSAAAEAGASESGAADGPGRDVSGGSAADRAVSDKTASDRSASAAPGGTADPPAGAGAQSGAETLREELERVRERLTQLERERTLLSQGVPEEDLDYYVFRIGKLASGEKDFDTAAREYLKEHGVPAREKLPRSTGASLSGRAARPRSTNDTMNQLLRGA